MPDAGDFDNAQRSANPGWSDAFAVLPQEMPDAGGWQRVQARLPTPARARWPLWLATAASLVLAVAIPLAGRHSREGGNPRTFSASLANTSQAAPPAHAGASTPSIAATAKPTSMDSRLRGNDEQKQQILASRSNPRRATRTTPSQRPIRTVAQPADATRIAEADAPTSTDLEPLYAQSAQLESLLAMARDERVASGTSAALSDGLDAQVASIDDALIQPDLSDAQRAELWGERVEALQQLVGIETTNRLYAARGQRYDAALVSID